MPDLYEHLGVPLPEDHQRAQAAYDANPALQQLLEAALSSEVVVRPRRRRAQGEA